MGDLVNLRMVKKRRAKTEAAADAAARRVKFGRTKAEKLAEAAARSGTDRVLDQARLDPAPSGVGTRDAP